MHFLGIQKDDGLVDIILVDFFFFLPVISDEQDREPHAAVAPPLYDGNQEREKVRVEQTGSEILRSNITKKTTLYRRRYAFTASNRISLSLIGWNYDGVKSDSFAFSARASALIYILCRDLAIAVPSAL